MINEEWIKAKTRNSEYFVSRHGDQERQNDNLTITEIENALLNGKILEQYPDTGRGESCLVVGFTEYGKTNTYCLRQTRSYHDNHNSVHSWST
ncbi:MAG TPA: DUF4258 domain-containing protein [Crenotrichaceae bacterium]|nr:DUF4258 domain-containing protein [Crenotrichaceae bacterium]